jgi:hypothetical protein
MAKLFFCYGIGASLIHQPRKKKDATKFKEKK